MPTASRAVMCSSTPAAAALSPSSTSPPTSRTTRRTSSARTWIRPPLMCWRCFDSSCDIVAGNDAAAANAGVAASGASAVQQPPQRHRRSMLLGRTVATRFRGQLRALLELVDTCERPLHYVRTSSRGPPVAAAATAIVAVPMGEKASEEAHAPTLLSPAVASVGRRCGGGAAAVGECRGRAASQPRATPGSHASAAGTGAVPVSTGRTRHRSRRGRRRRAAQRHSSGSTSGAAARRGTSTPIAHRRSA